jgi:hypothetical protein
MNWKISGVDLWFRFIADEFSKIKRDLNSSCCHNVGDSVNEGGSQVGRIRNVSIVPTKYLGNFI